MYTFFVMSSFQDRLKGTYLSKKFSIYISEKLVDVNFEDLLSFITGAGEIPVNGFESKMYMEFYDNDGEKRLPFSSTCSLTFSLPRGCSCDVLSALIVRALKESQGFHKI